MSSTSQTLLVVGSGPGIGRAVTTLFASKGYTNVVLVARRADSLRAEQAAVEEAVGSHVKFHTVSVDITDTDALLKGLEEADTLFGKPDCVFFNAARVIPSAFFEHDVKEIEYDLKINVSSLYIIAQRYMPHLVALAKKNGAPQPALIVTSSLLPQHPIPQLFALSLVKAAQRNMVQSLQLQFGPEGVHIGVINVQGVVSPEDPERNPTLIATKTWEWFVNAKEKPAFEVVV